MSDIKDRIILQLQRENHELRIISAKHDPNIMVTDEGMTIAMRNDYRKRLQEAIKNAK